LGVCVRFRFFHDKGSGSDRFFTGLSSVWVRTHFVLLSGLGSVLVKTWVLVRFVLAGFLDSCPSLVVTV